MEENVFLYSVNPRKVITGISGVNAIRTPKSLYLTKEDVKTCLKNASVYRRFANEGINEKVNVGNIDRVHRENYISEEDWPAFLANEKSNGHATISETKVEEKKPVVEEVKKETVVEPVKPEVVEEKKEESNQVVENVPEHESEKVEETKVEESTKPVEEKAEVKVEEKKNNNNQQKNKKNN